MPDLLARFDDLLLRHSDDLKKEALKELIPSALEQAINDILMYRDVKEDTLSSAQVRSIIDSRICAARAERTVPRRGVSSTRRCGAT